MAKGKFEIYNVDTGRTIYLTRKQADARFGHDEFEEMLQGYLPNWVVVEL